MIVAPCTNSRQPSQTSHFFRNDTATTEIYTLSLHDALPICRSRRGAAGWDFDAGAGSGRALARRCPDSDRKSTRLHSSHSSISYAVFCLKKNRGAHGPRPEVPAPRADRHLSEDERVAEVLLSFF